MCLRSEVDICAAHSKKPFMFKYIIAVWRSIIDLVSSYFVKCLILRYNIIAIQIVIKYFSCFIWYNTNDILNRGNYDFLSGIFCCPKINVNCTRNFWQIRF